MTLTSRCMCIAILFIGSARCIGAERSYRLKDVDLKQPVIWSSTCEGADGFALAFGGMDQKATDGNPHTRIRENGAWRSIVDDLRAANALQKLSDKARAAAEMQKLLLARSRWLYLEGKTPAEQQRLIKEELAPMRHRVLDALGGLLRDLRNDQSTLAANRLEKLMAGIPATLTVDAAAINAMLGAQLEIEKTAEMLDAEPPPRALSPIAYDPAGKLFYIFGGDHLDYLTNDLWTFDPAKRKWMQRQVAMAPPPRANHTLTIENGNLLVSGGYRYTSNTDYCGGQYADLAAGAWTYDIAANAWGGGNLIPSDTRVYRTGPFDPAFFLDPPPEAAAFADVLKQLPPNTWVSTKPPKLPRLNRDWGSAVLDVDRDLILRWSGGHSAHGGTDVLQYHIASNRWELPCFVEFPLGQLYSNTSYPAGVSFNRRAWITGHTYQSYGYDPIAHKMLFLGQTRDCFVYDPQAAEWTGTLPKPRELAYDSCYYTITLCPTPQGLHAWTQSGKVCRFLADKMQWEALAITGEKLPGSVVDNSTLTYDSKRNRLLFLRKEYGDKARYDGRLHALNLDSLTVEALSPRGLAAAVAVPYLCQVRYDGENDLLLVGGLLPADAGGIRRTPAYDCAGNRWISLNIGGADPSGKQGRNVSLGMMYDAKRKLFWAVNTNSNVYVLRLDIRTADPRDLPQ